MIYAINKHTKEHRKCDLPSGVAGFYIDAERGGEWHIVHADDDGWIEWDGGECPLPGGSECGVKHRGGDVFDNTFAGSNLASDWSHTCADGDIIAYRPILDEPSEPEAPEWDGSGLPPVGCECEYYDAIQEKWIPASIVAHHINGEEAIWSESLAGGDLFYGTPHDFRPITTPAQRAEDEAIEEMARIIADGHDVYIGANEAADRLYHAIRDGKVPGVKLEDEP